MTTAKITKLGHGQYEVESFCQEGIAYFVDVAKSTCSCPHFTKRLVGNVNAEAKNGCKHIRAARAERFSELAQTAKATPTERLEALKDKYLGVDGAIWLAIADELEDRYQAETKETLRKARRLAEEQTRQQQRDVQLKALFA